MPHNNNKKSILLTNERQQLSTTVDYLCEGKTQIFVHRGKKKKNYELTFITARQQPTTIINNGFILSTPIHATDDHMTTS